MALKEKLLQPQFEQIVDEAELNLRPKAMVDYGGQDEVKQNLKIYIYRSSEEAK